MIRLRKSRVGPVLAGAFLAAAVALFALTPRTTPSQRT